jgi:DeoR/GlpR family transcriptional regulator of sugar metabolism
VLTRQRHDAIVHALQADGGASVRQLAERLAVSESTVRRDLDRLDLAGDITRTYGGAVLSRLQIQRTAAAVGDGETPLAPDTDSDAALKEALAARAAGLVPDDATVLLDIGTTTPRVARHLLGRPVTIITANLAVLDVVRSDPVVSVVMLGGVLRRNYQTLVGPLAEAALREIAADIAFLSCTGIRTDGRVLDNVEVEIPLKQGMLAAARRTVLFASRTKVPGSGTWRMCGLSEIDTVITTEGVDPAVFEPCRLAGGEVFVA